MKILFSALIALALLSSCDNAQQEYFTKSVTFPEGATIEQKIDIASRIVPTPQQLEWQNGELTAFLHFGMNTFTGKEWGNPSSYHMVINTSGWNLKELAFAVSEFANHYFK